MAEMEIQPPSPNKGENKGLENLIPWKPGQSGNPRGRPKIDPEVKALLAAKGPRAIERICELIESDDERIALMAAKEIADRAYGKAKTIEDEESDARSVTINILRMAPDGNHAPAPVAAAAVSVRTVAIS